MGFPNELKYTKDHEWVLVEGNTATVGITAYALEQLGDVVHIELPEVGEEFSDSDTFGTIESTKTVSDLYMPVEGKVVSVNNDLEDDLDTLTSDAYKAGWLVKIEFSELSDELLSAEEYEAFISEDE